MMKHNRPRNYILNEDGEPVPEPDILAWAMWFEAHPDARRVAKDELPGGVEVSTVFLGLDHSFTPGGRPILFETMIFNGPFDQEQERYYTRAAAEAGHARIVRALRDGTYTH